MGRARRSTSRVSRSMSLPFVDVGDGLRFAAYARSR
jgi:hypothetical protein